MTSLRRRMTEDMQPALRFLYKITLHKDWDLAEVIPTPKLCGVLWPLQARHAFLAQK